MVGQNAGLLYLIARIFKTLELIYQIFGMLHMPKIAKTD